MCILSLDSSTLPSSSMTPGKVRRVPDTAGTLTAATRLWKRTSGRCRPPSEASCGSPISVCWIDQRTGEEEELLWRVILLHLPLRPGTENREWFLPVVGNKGHSILFYSSGDPTDTGRETNFKGKVRATSTAPRTLTAPFGSHMTAPWGPSPGPHSRWLPSHTWEAKFTTKDVKTLVTPSSDRSELNHWPPNLKFYL